MHLSMLESGYLAPLSLDTISHTHPSYRTILGDQHVWGISINTAQYSTAAAGANRATRDPLAVIRNVPVSTYVEKERHKPATSASVRQPGAHSTVAANRQPPTASRPNEAKRFAHLELRLYRRSGIQAGRRSSSSSTITRTSTRAERTAASFYRQNGTTLIIASSWAAAWRNGGRACVRSDDFLLRASRHRVDFRRSTKGHFESMTAREGMKRLLGGGWESGSHTYATATATATAIMSEAKQTSTSPPSSLQQQQQQQPPSQSRLFPIPPCRTPNPTQTHKHAQTLAAGEAAAEGAAEAKKRCG